AEHLALRPDGEEHEEQQHDDDPDRLDHPDPPGVVGEVGSGGGDGVAHHHGRDHHRVTSRSTSSPAPAPSISCTWDPGEFSGSQTTSSDIVVTASGRVMLPAGPRTVTGAPSVAPSWAARAAERRTTGRCAVPARCGSPSWPRPASSMSFQVARTACPGPAAGAVPGVTALGT